MTSPGAAGPSAPLLERIKAAAAAGGAGAGEARLLDEVEGTLLSEAAALNAGDGDVKGKLFDEPFILLDFLVPLVSATSSECATSDRAQACLNLVASVSAPKEVAMGIEQKLAELVPEDGSASENEDDSGDEAASWDAHDAVARLACLMSLYERALPRIETKRPEKFAQPACQAILSALESLVAAGAFASSAEEDCRGPRAEPLAWAVFKQLVTFIDTLIRMPNGSGNKDSPFAVLFFESVAYLHAYLPVSHMVDGLVRERMPRDRQRITSAQTTVVTETWKQAIELTVHAFDAPLSDLLRLAEIEDVALDLRLGYFVTAMHSLALETPEAIAGPYESENVASLEAMLPLLREALAQSALRLGDDELLFCLHMIVEAYIGRPDNVIMSLDLAFQLLELITPLASQSPSPHARLLALTLLERLVMSYDARLVDRSTDADGVPALKGTSTASTSQDEGEAAQFTVLRILAVDCPFANMRDAAVGLVKKLLLLKLDLPANESSLFLSDTLFSSPLGITLLTAFPASPSDGSTLKPPANAEDFVEEHHRGVMERLSLVYVLLKRDTSNRTHIASRTTLERLEASLLEPVSYLVKSWSSVSVSRTLELELELVRDLLERVEGAVREVRR